MKGEVRVIILGILLWVIFLLIAFLLNLETKVIYTALIGIALGLIGIRYTIRRAKREGL
jgi:hypothetical protein